MNNNEIIHFLTEKPWVDTLRNKIIVKKIDHELYYFYNGGQTKFRLEPPNTLYISTIKGTIRFFQRTITWTNGVIWFRKEHDNLDLYYTNRGPFYILPNDFWFVNQLKNGVAWENGLIERAISFIRDKRNVLDIGSHVGLHSIPYSRVIRGRVYAFEMQTPIYEILLKNIQLNSVENIVAHNCAVGHLNEETVSINDEFIYKDKLSNGIQYDTKTPTNYGGVQIGRGKQKVQMRTIDSFQLEDVDYIKVDIEGCEELALYGALETIRRCRPVICFELRPDVVINENMRSVLPPIDDNIINGNTLRYIIKQLKYTLDANADHKMSGNYFLVPQ